MNLAWKRLDAEASAVELDAEASPDERIAAPLSESARPWILWLGEDDAAAERAARRFRKTRARDVAVVSPPAELPLPLAVHQLPPPGLRGERILYLPRLHEAFFDTLASGSFSAASPLYLLPAVSQLASEGEPLTVLATAAAPELERCGKEVLARRGLSSRFEIRRVDGDKNSKREAEASTPYEDVDVDGDAWSRHLARGLGSRDPESRRRSYEEALLLAPEDALCHLFLASSLLERRLPREAVAALGRALELDPALASAHYEMGKARIQTDDLEGAVASFRRTVELLPEYASAWGNLGAALGELQDLEGAAAALQRAVSLDPASHALHSNLGVTCRDRGRLDEAERAFRKSLEIEPGFVFGHYNLAHTLYLGGRYPAAIEAFERAQSMDPSRSPRQALLLAVTRLASGDTEAAERDYRDVFTRVSPPMRADMRAVAEWDLEQLSRRRGATPVLEEAAELLRSLA
jgi:tetratricopeptide (TPR) repeat protein